MNISSKTQLTTYIQQQENIILLHIFRRYCVDETQPLLPTYPRMHTLSSKETYNGQTRRDMSEKEAKQTKLPIANDVLEEDDDFEEFELNNWSKDAQDTDDNSQFKSSWDDDDGADDQFTQQLRSELA